MHPITRWWYDYPGDVRDVPPPPGACRGRIHHDGDPSTPCILPEGHEDDHEDPEGYTESD